MQYRWDNFSLDRKGTLLVRQGQQIDVSRKLLDCLSHLIENRDRVVGYDELIRKIWGHDNVTNHQLTQVILLTRRALGDDGQAQRLIRTMPGLGYRWVGDVFEGNGLLHTATVSGQKSEDNNDSAHAVLQPTPINEPSLTTVPNFQSNISTSNRPSLKVVVCLLLLILGTGTYFIMYKWGDTRPNKLLSTPVDPMAALNEALRVRNFKLLREGLATLPPHLADSPDARILEIELDFKQSRFSQAQEKLEKQMLRPEAASDPILRARLLILKSSLEPSIDDKPLSERLALAESIIVLLDSAGNNVPLDIRGQAMERRAWVLIRSGRLEGALRDLLAADDIYKRNGNQDRAIDVKSNIGRVWMRMGRLQDALNQLREAADGYRENGNQVGEIFAVNTMTRIQMELLRWDEALVSNERSMQILHEVPGSNRRPRCLDLRSQILIANGQLRLAASQLDELTASGYEIESYVTPAWYFLESGDAAGALRSAAKGLDKFDDTDENDILLDSKDGGLLLWMTAAQKLADSGMAMPTLTPVMQKHLQKPRTALTRIANGRWLWSQGKRREAEAEFRQALEHSRRMNHLFQMTLAAEPLVEMLLQSGGISAAQAVMTDLRAFDSVHMDRDYRTNLLRLRVALAAGDREEAAVAYRNVTALAGERILPAQLQMAYGELYLRPVLPTKLAKS